MPIPKSTTLLQEYFSNKGYTVTSMGLGEPHRQKFITMKSPEGKYLTLSDSLPTYPFATAAAEDIINDKIKTYDFAKLLGITVPVTYVIPAEGYDRSAVHHLLETYKPLVVKPHDSYQSRGVSTNITTQDALRSAIANAGEVSKKVLVQQQVVGEELRFIAVDGVIRSVLFSQKPCVTGDGMATIAELIEEENELRGQITDSVLEYPLLDEKILATELLTDTRIPEMGERVELGTARMIYLGASVYDIFDQVHLTYIEIATMLTERFGKGLTAVDLIVQEYTKPARHHNYALLEMNNAISLPMCYSCRDGKQFRIVEEYLGPMLERAIA